MKKLFYTLGLALAVWGGAAAESLDRELGALATTRSNLFNIATALQMWAHDHQGQFPPTLEPLESNYLHRIPQQMDGSRQWNYQIEGDGFRLSDHWEGFTRLGLPAQVRYDSRTGLDTLNLPAELMALSPALNLEGQWLRTSLSPGLTVSWERFERKISARVLGPTSLDETFAQQKQRAGTNYLRWGWKLDDGDFARAITAAVPSGWSLDGIYTLQSQLSTKAILLTRGQRLLEIMVQDSDSRDALGSMAPVRSLLAQL